MIEITIKWDDGRVVTTKATDFLFSSCLCSGDGFSCHAASHITEAGMESAENPFSAKLTELLLDLLDDIYRKNSKDQGDWFWVGILEAFATINDNAASGIGRHDPFFHARPLTSDELRLAGEEAEA